MLFFLSILFLPLLLFNLQAIISLCIKDITPYFIQYPYVDIWSIPIYITNSDMFQFLSIALLCNLVLLYFLFRKISYTLIKKNLLINYVESLKGKEKGDLEASFITNEKGVLLWIDDIFKKIFNIFPNKMYKEQLITDVILYNKFTLIGSNYHIKYILSQITKRNSFSCEIPVNSNLYTKYFRVSMLRVGEDYIGNIKLVESILNTDNIHFNYDILHNIPLPYIVIDNKGEALFINDMFFDMFLLSKNSNIKEIKFSDYILQRYSIQDVKLHNIMGSNYGIDKCLLKDSLDREFVAYLLQSVFYENDKIRYVRITIIPDNFTLDTLNTTVPLLENGYFKSIFNNLKIGVIVFSINYEVIDTNVYARELFPNLLQCNNIYELFGDNVHSVLQHFQKNNSQEKLELVIEIEQEQKTLSYQAIKEVVYYVLLIEDVTHLRKMTTDLKLYRGLQTLGQLSSIVAHDFNNLLTAIQGNIYFLQQKLDTDDEMWHDVGNMENIANRARVLIKQLLTFSRSTEINPLRFNLEVELSDLLSTIGKLVGDNVKLEFTKNIPLNHCVLFDKGHFSQIITNLVTNARYAMRNKSGVLSIRTYFLDLENGYSGVLHDILPGSYNVVEVTDYGEGIAKNRLKLIFQSHYSTKGDSGNGLGLHTVLSIMRDNGGFVDVKSQEGFGSSFYLYFPLNSDYNYTYNMLESKNQISDIQEEIPKIIDDTGSESILLVEDDVSVRRVLTKVLKDKGYVVYSVDSGEEALELLDEHQDKLPLDLLISDVSMPNMKGPEVASKVKQRYANIKILLISGYSNEVVQDIENDAYLKKIHFLAKPFSPTILVKQVRDIIVND